MLLSLDEALANVQLLASKLPGLKGTERISLRHATGRVLGADVRADRDQPPFHRSTRDGFAVRSQDLQGPAPRLFSCLGELPAGQVFGGVVGEGQCVEIMTGAPLPTGTDAVVMVEHSRWKGQPPLDSKGEVELLRVLQAGDNVVPQGAEACVGNVVMAAGRRLDAAAIGLLASVGAVELEVVPVPRVAILTTGDEVVEAHTTPAAHQIRNSNEYLLASAVERAGGVPVFLPPAMDEAGALSAALLAALDSDLVVMTGGVSKGKHDHVKDVLAKVEAASIFQGVAIRPGKPVVLCTVQRGERVVPVLALPGNPLSALVAFGLFGRSLVDRLGGGPGQAPNLLHLPVAASFAWRPLEFTAFVPATFGGAPGQTTITLHASHGSGDLVSAAVADGFACIPAQSMGPSVGQMIAVLPMP